MERVGSSVVGISGEGMMNRQSTEDFRVVKLLSVIQRWIHVTIHLSKVI